MSSDSACKHACHLAGKVCDTWGITHTLCSLHFTRLQAVWGRMHSELGEVPECTRSPALFIESSTAIFHACPQQRSAVRRRRHSMNSRAR